MKLIMVMVKQANKQTKKQTNGVGVAAMTSDTGAYFFCILTVWLSLTNTAV